MEKRASSQGGCVKAAVHIRNSAGQFRSTRILEGDREPDKQWTRGSEGRRILKRSYLVVIAGIVAGIFFSFLRIGLQVFNFFEKKGTYCLVLEDHFDGPLNTSIWNHEISVGGFGNDEFEWTTNSTNNSWTENGKLYIAPTFTADIIGEAALNDGYLVNLTADGTCTTPEYNWTRIDTQSSMQVALNSTNTQCQARSNATLGTMVPPIQSARLNTKGKFSIRYGRVEVKIKSGTGDWNWPAVWMLPEESIYGKWPLSGEIDIFEAIGNLPILRKDRSTNQMTSTIHVGYDDKSNLSNEFIKQRKIWRNYFNEDYHTFGLEWDEHGIWTWEGNRNRRIMDVKFDRPFLERTKRQYDPTGAYIPPPNPWILAKNNAAPFDQKFYLILNVAVGGGIFQTFATPWSFTDASMARTFWKNKDISWGPTWPKDPRDRALVVEYVKMWQRC